MVAKFGKIKDGQISLYVIVAKKYLGTDIKLVDHYLNKEKYNCVYISINKPYVALMELFKKNKIKTDNLIIIDAITPTGFGAKKIDNAIFLGSPKSLTNISLVTFAALDKLKKGKTILFLDSLSTLCVYNELGSVTKFAHFLVNKMHEGGFGGTILSVEKEDMENIVSELSQFCDNVVEIK